MHLSLTKESVLALCHFLCHAGSGHGSNSVLDLTFYGGSVPVLLFLLEVVTVVVVLLHFDLFMGFFKTIPFAAKCASFEKKHSHPCVLSSFLFRHPPFLGIYKAHRTSDGEQWVSLNHLLNGEHQIFETQIVKHFERRLLLHFGYSVIWGLSIPRMTIENILLDTPHVGNSCKFMDYRCIPSSFWGCSIHHGKKERSTVNK